MSTAEWILWFAATACFGGALCYFVRGILGEKVRLRSRDAVTRSGAGRGTRRFGGRRGGGTRQISWPLIGLACGLLLLAIAAVLGLLVVRSWFSSWNHRANDEAVAAIASGLLVPCMVLLTVGVIGDRSKGRLRCPSCWYDMAGSGDDLAESARCPECGREVFDEADLERTRRRAWPFVLAALMLGLSMYCFTQGGRIARGGWRGAIPTTALTLGWKWLPESVILELREETLILRIEPNGRPPLFLDGLTKRAVMESSDVWVVARAVRLRRAMAGSYAPSMMLPNTGQSESADSVFDAAMMERLGDMIRARPAPGLNLALDDAYDEIAAAWTAFGGRLTEGEAIEILDRCAAGEPIFYQEMQLIFSASDRHSVASDAVFSGLLRALESRPSMADTRRLLAIMLGRASRGDEERLGRVHAMSEDADGDIRLDGLLAMAAAVDDAEGDQSEISRRFRDRLLNAFDDPHDPVRVFAAQRAIESYAADHEIMARLVRLLGSGDAMRREYVPKWYFGDLPVGVDLAIAELLADGDELVRAAAMSYFSQVLWRHGPNEERIEERILEIMGRADLPAGVRAEIKAALGDELGL